MRTETELKQRMAQYIGAEYIYIEDVGYIAWQMSTGENIEIIFIEAKEKNKGHGKMLVKQMCERIKPYHSVFVFRLASNECAGEFYRGIGFTETTIKGLYKGIDAVLGVVPYETLCQKL